MAASPPPRGVYVPVPTFFSPPAATASSSVTAYVTPELDLAAQTAHALYLAHAGIKGLVILGTTGEAVHLHPRERNTVIRAVRDALDKDGLEGYPVIAGTATQSVEETVEQLVDAKKAGAQWGLCLAPGYNASAATEDGVVRWFEAVAGQSPIPVMIYYFPGVSNGLKLAPSAFERLAKHPNIVGCKLSHGDVSHHIQIASSPTIPPSSFAVFTGFGQQLSPLVAAGGAGAIDASAGFFPKSLVRLYQLASKDSGATAEEAAQRRELQWKVSRMVEEVVVKQGLVGAKEATRRLRGFGKADTCRVPLGGFPGGEEGWAKVKGVVDVLEEVERSL